MAQQNGFFANAMVTIITKRELVTKGFATVEIKHANGVIESMTVKSLDKIRLEWGDSVTCVFGAVRIHALDTPLGLTAEIYTFPILRQRKRIVIDEPTITELRAEYAVAQQMRPGIRVSNNVDMSKYAGSTGR